MLGEIRIYGSTSAAQTSGVPWTLIRRGVALSEHARFANNLIASAVHVRSSMKDVPSRQLALALSVAGFTARDVPQPAALRAETWAVTRRGRPSVWTRADYARVALLYDDAVAAGRSPQQAVAKAIGRPVTVARNLIAKARKLELIPKAAKQGRWSLERLSRSQRLALSREARDSSIRGDRS